MSQKHELDSFTQPSKRPCLGPEAHSNILVKDYAGLPKGSLPIASPTKTPKRTRNDGSIAACDKQPRLQEVYENCSREDAHNIYYEINQYLGELHFQRQVRELRNRLAAQQSPSKLSAY